MRFRHYANNPEERSPRWPRSSPSPSCATCAPSRRATSCATAAAICTPPGPASRSGFARSTRPSPRCRSTTASCRSCFTPAARTSSSSRSRASSRSGSRTRSAIARRVDFSIDLDSGRWTQTPLEQVAGLLTQLAQQFVIDELVKLDIRAILTGGVAPIRDRIAAGLDAEGALAELGLEIVAVRVAAVAPTSELEKALQQPTREAIQQRADEATFSRRALAVEKERAIADNELKNRIELARREEELVSQDGVNARRRAEEDAVAQLVGAHAEDERAELRAEREARRSTRCRPRSCAPRPSARASRRRCPPTCGSRSRCRSSPDRSG